MGLIYTLERIHVDCHRLCRKALGRYLPVAGNIGVFCQSDEEFEMYTKVRERVTHQSDDPNQKYFALKEPIVMSAHGDIPSATYTHLYIRKPNPESPEAGDVDFVLSKDEYAKLKDRIIGGEAIPGASIYDRPGWDTIEVRDPHISALAYIGTQEMAEKARKRF